METIKFILMVVAAVYAWRTLFGGRGLMIRVYKIMTDNRDSRNSGSERGGIDG